MEEEKKVMVRAVSEMLADISLGIFLVLVKMTCGKELFESSKRKQMMDLYIAFLNNLYDLKDDNGGIESWIKNLH